MAEASERMTPASTGLRKILDAFDIDAVDKNEKSITVDGRKFYLQLSNEDFEKLLEAWRAFKNFKLEIIKAEDEKIWVRAYVFQRQKEEYEVSRKHIKSVDGQKTLVCKEVEVVTYLLKVDLFTGEVIKKEEIDVKRVCEYEPEVPEDDIPSFLGLKVVDFKEFPRPPLAVRYKEWEATFNDGAVLSFHGHKTLKDDEGEYQVPDYRLNNGRYDEDVYIKAVDIYFKNRAEEQRLLMEKMKEEIEKAHKEQEKIEEFLLSKQGAVITIEELEWLQSISPTSRHRYYYFDGVNGIYVLDLFDKVEIKVSNKVFKVPKGGE